MKLMYKVISTGTLMKLSMLKTKPRTTRIFIKTFLSKKIHCSGDWRDSTVGKVLLLHSADPSSIPSITYGPLNLPEVIPEESLNTDERDFNNQTK